MSISIETAWQNCMWTINTINVQMTCLTLVSSNEINQRIILRYLFWTVYLQCYQFIKLSGNSVIIETWHKTISYQNVNRSSEPEHMFSSAHAIIRDNVGYFVKGSKCLSLTFNLKTANHHNYLDRNYYDSEAMSNKCGRDSCEMSDIILVNFYYRKILDDVRLNVAQSVLLASLYLALLFQFAWKHRTSL